MEAYPRKRYDQLKEQRTNDKISLLIGARQTGKTTLLRLLYEHLSNQYKTLFLDLDIVTNYEKINTYDKLVNTLNANGYEEEEPFYLFLDEFQRYEELPKILKNAYDHLDVKIYASGSSSLDIMERSQESLAGRKIINYLHSLDFEEYLWFKDDEQLIEQYENAPGLEGTNLHESIPELHASLKEYLRYGGYPEVVLSQNKEQVLESIFDLYVKKDLVNYMDMSKFRNVKQLIETLAVNHGQKVKKTRISDNTGLTYREINKYLNVLENTFLIQRIRPFYTNKNKEIVKAPKTYYVDPGVRNHFIQNHNPLELRNDAGELFEGFILAELLKHNTTPQYWQDKNQHEVDFILDKTPVEVKFKHELTQRDFNGLQAYTERNDNHNAYLINTGMQEQRSMTTLLPYSLQRLPV